MQVSENGLTILVVGDETEAREYLDVALKCSGYAVELANDGDGALACLRAYPSGVAAVLLCTVAPDRDGLDFLREIRQIAPNLPVIMVSSASSTVNVVTAMKNGVADFLPMPVALEDLRAAVRRVVEQERAEYVTSSGRTAPPATAFLGRSPRMQDIQTLVAQIGWSEAPVLIQGETGSGKEVIARELHAQSPRASKRFLKLNCAALPSELVESELFGYERGAFTGAFQKKSGMFEQADQGTIMLDEIGDMDVRLQAKLLQVLQDHEFQRIGGRETVRVDVRIMAATHRDLEKAIAEGTFREDLYYRLNVISLQLPPLRERPEDIIPLAELLLKKHATPGTPLPLITPELRRAMTSHYWPGNVRELENVMRKLLVLRDAGLIARDLAASANRRTLRSVASPGPQLVTAASPILEQVSKAKQRAEKEAILAALESTRWNRKQAAALLRVDYKALLYKMKKLGMEDQPIPLLGAASSDGESAMASSA